MKFGKLSVVRMDERRLLQLYQLIKDSTKEVNSVLIDRVWKLAVRKGLYARVSAFKRALLQLQERELIEVTNNFRVRVRV